MDQKAKKENEKRANSGTIGAVTHTHTHTQA